MTLDPGFQIVVLTPEGRSALATVLVAGENVAAVVGRLFHPASGRPIATQPVGKILFGRWASATVGEEVVLVRRDSRTIEINGHGGHAAVRAIVASLLESGGVSLDWRQWILESEPDEIAAAARLALASASTEPTAAILCDQLRGALRNAIQELALACDHGQVAAAHVQLDVLLAPANLGLHLTRPWRVVLAGPPNAGKSSLINALVGFTRAIVHETPGTTRDLVRVGTAIDGWPVELVDTAGLHAAVDSLEVAGIELARGELATADLIVLVHDSSVRWQPIDEAWLAHRSTPLLVHSKCDLAPAGVQDRPAGLSCSTVLPVGIDELQRGIVARLVPHALRPGQAVPFTIEQVTALQVVRQSLAAGQPEVARRLLQAAPFRVRAPC